MVNGSVLRNRNMLLITKPNNNKNKSKQPPATIFHNDEDKYDIVPEVYYLIAKLLFV